MDKILDVLRRWLVPASTVSEEARVVVVNEIGGAVYEVTQDSHLRERADVKVKEASVGGRWSLDAPIIEE